MNPGRGWNPNLEGSYLAEYSESEAKFWIQCNLGFYIQLVKVSSPEPSPISIYSECTKTTSFSILGFFRLEVKLGFDFLRVWSNQKYQPRSLKFNFNEEINPMLGSLKNSSSVKIRNFPHRKLKNLGIEFFFNKKMRPSMESQPSIHLPMDCGERPKK